MIVLNLSKLYNLNPKHTPGKTENVIKYKTTVNIFRANNNCVNSKNDISLLVLLLSSSSFNSADTNVFILSDVFLLYSSVKISCFLK